MKNLIIGLLIILSLLLLGINIHQDKTIRQQKDVIVQFVMHQLATQNKCNNEGLDHASITIPRI